MTLQSQAANYLNLYDDGHMTICLVHGNTIKGQNISCRKLRLSQGVCCNTTPLGKGDAALSRCIPLACGCIAGS